MTDIAEKIAGCSGGQKCYWEVVCAINGGDSRATAVAVQKFLGSDGSVCAQRRRRMRTRRRSTLLRSTTARASAQRGQRRPSTRSADEDRPQRSNLRV